MPELTSLSGRHGVIIVRAMAAAVSAQREMLNALDSAMGDGDHGTNISAAMEAATQAVNELDHPIPADVLTTVGLTVRESMGGASGAIFGAFFRGCGRSVQGLDSLEVAEVEQMLLGGLTQVQKRGKVQIGEKTMLDALAPAVDAFQQAHADGQSLVEAVTLAAQAATSGAKSTQQMVATAGRARYLGERSLGHQDAGATSVALMLTAWADALENLE